MMEEPGKRTTFDVGAVLRQWGPQYSRAHRVTAQQRKVMRALAACRTAALGGHLEQCDRCGYEHPVYNSCGNRHCPTCLGVRARRWLSERLGEVLNTAYFHCIFTIPDRFNVLVPYNEPTLYNALFEAAAWTLQRFARRELGGEAGVVAILHTWGQALWLHPHIHTIVTGGALSADRRQWRSTGDRYLFDVRALSATFRDRFCTLLKRARLVTVGDAAVYGDRNALLAFIAEQQQRDWVVFCKPPVRGPRQVLEYISRYTHRVAISNRRILDVAADGTVTFSYKDYRHTDGTAKARVRTLRLSASDFIGRFLRHVLPCGFRKVRTYGLLAGRTKCEKVAAARALLGPVPDAPATAAEIVPVLDPNRCPRCGQGTLRRGPRLLPEPSAPVVLKCVLEPDNHKAA